MIRASPVAATIDLHADGVRHGHLKLPHSRDESAWGALMVPVAVIKRGDGPTALLTGANHGDEYEGPIALFDLARTLTRGEVRGRVIIVPAMNYPAFRAGRRTSPVDGGNMNRVFPGRPDGTPTEKIADYFQRVLLPQADIVLDLHSGGRSLEFVPFAASHVLPDKAQQAACAAARDAFAAPWSMLLREIDAAGMYDTAAEEAGKVFVTTELGGGGTARPETIAIAKRGVRNLLIHAGILGGEPRPADTTLLEMPDEDCFVTSRHAGLVEPAIGLGRPVAAGEPVARIHDIARTGRAPVDYPAPRDGVLAGRHFPSHVQMGDMLAVLGVPRR